MANFAHCFVILMFAMLFNFLQLLFNGMITRCMKIDAFDLMLDELIDVLLPVSIALALFPHLVA